MKRLATKLFPFLILAALVAALASVPITPAGSQPLPTSSASASWRMTYISKSKVDVVNTNMDGSGTMVLLGRTDRPVWFDHVVWHSLGTNAVCVGRIFCEYDDNTDDELDKHLLVESTLAATTASNTAKLTEVKADVGTYLPPGTSIWAAVSVDLTGSAGYSVRAALGELNLDF